MEPVVNEKEGWRHYLLLRMFAALSTGLLVFYGSTTAYMFFTNVVESSVFVSPGFGSYDLEKELSAGPDHATERPFEGVLLPVSLILGALSFASFFCIGFGKPSGGRISLSDAFDRRAELYRNIREGLFSVKAALIAVIAASALLALYHVLFEYFFYDATIAPFTGIGLIEGASPSSAFPLAWDWGYEYVALFIPALLSFFAAPFILYWMTRAFGGKAGYLGLFALNAYLYAIPAAFYLAALTVPIAYRLFTGTIPLFSMVFFPYLGLMLFYAALIYGIRDYAGLSLWRSAAVVLPLIVVTLSMMYLNYLLVYVVPGNILQITLWQLGVYNT